MKKIIIIATIIIIALFIASLIKDQIIKSAVSVLATQVTGARVDINGFSLGVLKQSVRISGFKMYNPKGFSDGILMDLPKVAVDYDLISLLKGKLHLRLAEVDLKEIALENNKEGKLNVDSLKIAQQQEAKAAKEKKAAKQMPMQIDVLNLQMGRIVLRDYTAGKEPSVKVYDINLKKSYNNITSASQLAALILTEPMKHAGIKGAGIYGAALLTGVGVVPVAIVSALAGKDSVQQNLNIPIDNLYDISLRVLKRIGKVTKEDKAGGIIDAEVNGVSATLKLKKESPKNTQITISARKYMLPKPEVASGILYQITQDLK
jgi:membrane protein implicated in regulation of membrane protease activity